MWAPYLICFRHVMGQGQYLRYVDIVRLLNVILNTFGFLLRQWEALEDGNQKK